MPNTAHQFSWALLGDLELGRPHMGPTIRLEVYRLMQFTILDMLARRFDEETADEIFFEAGKLAGSQFYKNVLGHIEDFNDFMRNLQAAFKNMGIGILRVERADMENGFFVVTISEDLDCSGLPELDAEICVYEEGFITGLMESHTSERFKVKEVNCWCTGHRTCRFTAQRLKD